jgi:hypothetical protein
MSTQFEPILTRNIGIPNSETIRVYLERGGYSALKKALTLTPEEVTAEIRESGLRGRGGAGFPAGLKWGFMPKGDQVKYVCINTDEGEPGTFKDRLLVEHDPHSIIEGTIIAAYAVGAQRAFVYIRGEFFLGVKRWIKAIDAAYQHGYLGKDILGSGFDLDMSVHRGAGAYICGEETALINSLEGRRGEPRSACMANRRWCTTWRHWPTSRRSSTGEPPGSEGSAPSAAPVPSCSASAATCANAATMSFLLASRCARSFSSTRAECAATSRSRLASREVPPHLC